MNEITLSQDKTEEAVEHHLNSMGLDPENGDLYYNLGIKLSEQGRTEEAVFFYRKAIEMNPDDADAHYNLGIALNALGETYEAVSCYKKVLQINPKDFQAYNNMGIALKKLNKTSEAMACYCKALEINPTHLQAYNNLAIAFKDDGNTKEAIDCYCKALEINPDNSETYYNLANALYSQGNIDQSIGFFRKSLQIDPHSIKAHSNLLFAMNFDMNCSQSEFFTEANIWWRTHGATQAKGLTHSNPPVPHKRLKVGYVSPDFHRHSVSYFFVPLLAAHDRDQFEVFCYSETTRFDEITHRIRELADHWRPIERLNDDAAANLVIRDAIDILVDLAGHTAHSRLPVFTRKPAPVQVTWLGFPNTTGVKTIDYRLTDEITDPPEKADRYNTETLVRLPHGFLCYSPLEHTPDVTSGSSDGKTPITFGSFNNLSKINEKVIELWSRILHRIPGSHLILKSKHFLDNCIRQNYCAVFHQNNISTDRIEMLPFYDSSKDHMSLYNRIDIALDPFPYNGTTSTCEALWMGTPVITLEGDRHCSRVGSSILSRLNLTDLITRTEEAYVQRAVEIACDHDKRSSLRMELRKRMEESSLCNAEAFARTIEDAYQKMWRNWCQKNAK